MADKTFAVDKFLGINESADGTTELKLGESSKIENFYITDGYNLQTRPGTVRLSASTDSGHRAYALWDGLIGERHFSIVAYQFAEPKDGEPVELQIISRNDAARAMGVDGTIQVPVFASKPMKFFVYGNKLYFSGMDIVHDCPHFIAFYDDGSGQLVHRDSEISIYAPVILDTCSPEGGGEEREKENVLAGIYPQEDGKSICEWRARIQFSADGEAVEYHFPETVNGIRNVTVDGQPVTDGNFSEDSHSYTFAVAPVKGVNNVEFTVSLFFPELSDANRALAGKRYCEAYNGETDSRLFFYGDGTNICCYTGAPAFGEGLYVPLGNEVAVDSSASAVTALRRQNSQLLAFKPDGAFSVDYEPVTLADGKVVAGFYVRPLHRSLGNEMDNQVQTVNNYARTFCGGALYEWRSANAYHDERYAKRVSQKVARTLATADPARIVTCDDSATQTYYMFLNDKAGTVLVNRYALDVWTVYTGEIFCDVRFAAASQGDVLFTSGNGLFCLDAAVSSDAPVKDAEGTCPIRCNWESGFMAFGAENLRKYSSRLWISLLPQSGADLEITVQTDKRKDYLVKAINHGLLDFSYLDFSSFAFLTYDAPKIKRVQLKVKKFVYYKLILRVTKPNARATVLGYSQQVRYSSSVK